MILVRPDSKAEASLGVEASSGSGDIGPRIGCLTVGLPPQIKGIMTVEE